MEKVETISDFYRAKDDLAQKNIQQEIGHFNVFKLDPYVGNGAKPAPFRRRDYFKITLIEGAGKFHYADKAVKVNKYALVFSNPQIPYSWEQRDQIYGGYFCIFNQAFFHQFGDLNQYTAFQPTGNHVFELSDEQHEYVASMYNRMFDELTSDYVHKYDLLRTMVYELIHFAMKTLPSTSFEKQSLNASQGVSTLFLELLERQFPIDQANQKVELRTPSDYADKLNIHVNYLNRIIKKTLQKTTSQVIADRILQESKILLKQTSWPVADIAYSLGFTEPTHFNNFFKKHIDLTPVKFRKSGNEISRVDYKN